MAKKKVEVQGIEVRVEDTHRGYYYSLTDLVQGGEGDVSEVIRRWMRAQKTVDFLGVWEEVHNPDFNLSQMGQIKTQSPHYQPHKLLSTLSTEQ
jgi:KilA-N domain